MSLDLAEKIRERTHRLQLEEGVLLAKSWTPDTDEAGSRAPVVLFHDSLGCVTLWRGFPGLLASATGRRVIAYDRLGFGGSDPHPGQLGLDFISMESRRIMPVLKDQLGVRGFIACGHSVGGGMAAEAAARFPAQCQGLVTISAQAFVDERISEGLRATRRAFQNPDYFAKLTKYHGDKARWALDAWLETWLSPEFSSWNLDTALEAIRCPVLAVHGELDEYGSSDHAIYIARGRGHAHVLPGVGHNPHRECEALLVELIRDFTDRL